MSSVWLLTDGDGSDGDEWSVISIHATQNGARVAQEKYNSPQPDCVGGFYTRNSVVEEWELEP